MEKKTTNEKQEKLIKIIELEKIIKKNFPSVSLIEKKNKEELDIDWRIPECLVIKYNSNNSCIAAGYTDGHVIIYDMKNQESISSEKVKLKKSF